jgi:hypothetical protein
MKMLHFNNKLKSRIRCASNITYFKMIINDNNTKRTITYDGTNFIIDTQHSASFVIHGNKYWRVGGKLHRTDGPAIEYANGTKKWFFEGKLHRIDGPAIEMANGTNSWYLYGYLIKKE